jgi:hypothetical protein
MEVKTSYKDVMDGRTCPLAIGRGWHILWIFSRIYSNMLEHFLNRQTWALSDGQSDVTDMSDGRMHRQPWPTLAPKGHFDPKRVDAFFKRFRSSFSMSVHYETFSGGRCMWSFDQAKIALTLVQEWPLKNEVIVCNK